MKTLPHQWKKRALDAEKELKRIKSSPMYQEGKKVAQFYREATERVHNNWQLKFDMITQMFESVVDQVKENERHGRVLIESMRMSMDDFHNARHIGDTARAMREVKKDTNALVEWYDDIGYTGISEWFKAWHEDVNGIDHSAKNAGEVMDKIIENHGFDFTPRRIGVTWQEMAKIKGVK